MNLFKATFASSVLTVAFVWAPSVWAENLFSPVERSDMREAYSVEREESHKSVNHYKMKTDLVKTSAKSLTFNLDGLILKAHQSNAHGNAQGSLLWEGTLADEFAASRSDNAAGESSGGENSVILIKTEKGVTGTLRSEGRLFKISPAGNGVHTVIEVDESKMPDDHPPGAMQRLERESSFDLAALDFAGVEAIAEAAAPPDIRVLVPYTAKARQRAGDIRGLIELAVAETNRGYRNSGVNATMTLAHTYQVNYLENNNMDRDLDALIDTNDGVMDEVHARRNQHAADIVLLLTDTDDGCGLASSIGARASNAFGIVNWDCATGHYSFGHEAGHLQSARHDPDTDGSTRPYAFGHGFRYPQGNWRTIMSYSCQGGCRRINWWSNPDKRRGGVAMGTASRSNNARVLNLTAATIAAFRSGGSPPPPPPPPAGGYNGRTNLPGKIQAENYASAPVETTAANRNSAAITKCTYYGLGVDVQNSSASTCNVGWTTAGEQLTYRVGNAGGTYNIGVRLASTQNGRRVRVAVNNNGVGTVSTNGSGWQNYATETIRNVSVPANATVTVTFVDGNANLDFLDFTRAGGNPPPPTTTPRPTPVVTPPPPPPSGNCTRVNRKDRAEISLSGSNCVTFSESLAGRTLAVWDSDSNPSCDFRGTISSVDGSGSLNVSGNYVSSTSFTGRTVRFNANNGCRFVKVRFY